MRRDCGDETKETFIDGGKCANLGELEKQAKQNEDLLTEIGFEFWIQPRTSPPNFGKKSAKIGKMFASKKNAFFARTSVRSSAREVFITCSVSETFGLTVLEALACGLPVVPP